MSYLKLGANGLSIMNAMARKVFYNTYYLVAFLFLVSNFFISSISAQVTCTGAACSVLPSNIQLQLNSASQAIETQYTDKLLESMTEAAVLSNINSAMMGPGLVNRFQLGLGISAAGQKKDDINVVYQDLTFNKLPNVGANVTPNLNLAFNLGWLLGHGPSDTTPENSHFLHRFNVYLHGFQYNFANNDVQNLIKKQQDGLQLSGGISNYGGMIRFHLFPSYGDDYGIFEFSGISLGMGLHYQKQDISIIYSDKTAQSITLGPAIGTWSGDTSFQYKSTVTSIPLDVRTGFRIFYFTTLFAGVGTSLNFGSSTLDFSRSGPLSLTLEQSLISSQVPAALQALIPASSIGTAQTGTLSVTLNGKGNAPNSLGYVVGGLEFNLLFLKILVEGMVSSNIQSVNAGVKLAF